MSVDVDTVVTEPSGLVVVVVVLVLVPVVAVGAGVTVVTVPVGAGAFGLTTKSVGCTLDAGTTDVGRPVDCTGFDTVLSAGVGVPWAPTGTVFDSIEFGSAAGRLPMYVDT